MMHGDIEPDDRAVAPADDRSLWNFEEIHQCNDVLRHQVIAVWPGVAGAAAMAAAVHDDDAVLRLERLDLLAPVIRIGEPAMQQDDRPALAKAGVPDLDPVDRGEAALRRRRQRRRR